VHNKDIPTSVTSFFSVTLQLCVGGYCVVAPVSVVCSNKNPGIAAGVLHSLDIA
jgi:hypothetical protein